MDQIVKKALPIAQSLYLGYKLLFMFDNAIIHFIYAKDVQQVAYMNKGPSSQKLFFRTDWYIVPNRELII